MCQKENQEDKIMMRETLRVVRRRTLALAGLGAVDYVTLPSPS